MRTSDPVSAESVVDNSIPQSAAALVERLRARGPRVHCITNAVAQTFTANVLLAAGCIPSMTLAPEEIAGFVGSSDALLVNLGTLDPERRLAAESAVATAAARGVPWVLDPVFVDRSPGRAAFARALLARRPNVVRLNHAEFAALAEAEPTPEAVSAFAEAQPCVVALSGEADLIGNGARIVRVDNGHRLMTRVTAMGCAGSALLAACLAVCDDVFAASASALLLLGIAGEVAAERSQGPGSFAAGILDALYALDADTILTRAKCT